MNRIVNQRTGLRSARDTIGDPSNMLKSEILRYSMELMDESVASDRSQLIRIKQELSMGGGEKLYVHQKNDRFFFGAVTDAAGREVGITQDAQRIHALARRAYLEDQAAVIEKRCKRKARLRDAMANAVEEARMLARLGRFAEAGLDLCQIIFTKEQNEWLDQPYSPNPYYQEDLKYETDGHYLMRSNSEVRIGNMLERSSWPYRYDDLVVIGNDPAGPQPNRKNHFSDFKVPNLNGGITIHEHLGAFHIRGYADNALNRLNDYRNFEIRELPGRPVSPREITFSLENDLQEPELMRALLRRMLLPEG